MGAAPPQQGVRAEISNELAWSVAVSLDRIIPTEYLGRVVQKAVLHKDGEGPDKWWHLNLTVPVAKMLDWYIRYFPGDAYASIGDIQRQAHTTWNTPAADTLRALRQDSRSMAS